MEILFYIAAAIAIYSTLRVVTGTNPIHALLSLIVSLLSVAVIFFMLGAPFVGALEVIVYAGAIMVLFLYVLMLMDLKKETEPKKNRWLKLAGAVAGGSLLLVLIAALKKADLANQFAETRTGDIGLIENLGKVLFNEYVVPFEISSILFLSAMVGAVVIGKKE